MKTTHKYNPENHTYSIDATEYNFIMSMDKGVDNLNANMRLLEYRLTKLMWLNVAICGFIPFAFAMGLIIDLITYIFV